MLSAMLPPFSSRRPAELVIRTSWETWATVVSTLVIRLSPAAAAFSQSSAMETAPAVSASADVTGRHSGPSATKTAASTVSVASAEAMAASTIRQASRSSSSSVEAKPIFPFQRQRKQTPSETELAN